MLLTTRDAQRERRASQVIAAVSLAERLSLVGINNASFQMDSSSDLHTSDILSRVQSQSRFQPGQLSTIVDVTTMEPTPQNTEPATPFQRRRYHWRMVYYFYVHVVLFIISSLLSGLIVWLIENHSSARNLEMKVDYIDAWFMGGSCVCSCGLTTLDFAKLSRVSQSVLMFFTFISGVTFSTLPALIVKAHTHRRVEGITVDDDHGDLDDENPDELPTFNIRHQRNLPEHLRNRLAQFPTAAQLRYRAYITCIVLIMGTCFTIYTITFVAIGSWLSGQYTSEQLLQGNSSVNPWFFSFIVTVTGFNQNGLTPFSDGLSRFVGDIFLNLFLMMIVMSGTSLFPFLLRNVVILARRLSPRKHKVIFDYILLNNHRLSTLLFPSVQTRIYLLITVLLYILGVGISLILDLNRKGFASYSPGIQFLIFLFQTINTRFAGFQTIDISLLASGTLLVYLLLMATKPQMLCALDESPFELSWLAIQAKEEANAETDSLMKANDSPESLARSPQLESIDSSSLSGGALPMRHVQRFLRKQSHTIKSRAREEFTHAVPSSGRSYKPGRLRYLRTRLFLVYFVRALIKHIFSFVILTRTWLFFFIFLICAIEYRQMAPVDPNITVFKVIFEIISAFGTVGLTLGYPNVSSSFATVLSPASKVILVITMLMGRHRGLLASMKDQEAIEHSAADLINRQCEEIIKEYQRTTLGTNVADTTRPGEAVTQL
ncbi:unnamed protein product [Rotaria magnacalcarata]|uniref:Uncharacterized protein n=4 Tax=Rotaria magnacalcarata TaxID=392030 RepID=A0A816Q4W5_9BILA|nr:unnamed protein product [Rotaria magnacalcarata]CAF2057594.1 unnamed protein product [Rotaria magnacalcarata]CAF3981638.1 unnamed protein product [Rotaria magnacalcarata]CAF3985203.1 unnamed protein product [Rotaria magnacalcarata]